MMKAFFILCFLSLSFSESFAAGEILKTAAKNAKKVVKFSKRTIGGAVVWTMGSYVLTPDEVSVQSVADDLLEPVMPIIGGQTSSCDSVNCSRFVSQCAESLDLPKNSTPTDVTDDLHYKGCVKSFFTVPGDPESKKMMAEFCRSKNSDSPPPMLGCPLDIQSQLRSDPNLNRLLTTASPDVHDVNCAKENPEVQIYGKKKELYTQNIFYTKEGSVDKVHRSGAADGSSDRLFFKDGQPINLQHCEKNGKNCKLYDMKKVRTVRQYFFNGTKLTGIPHDSFEWARNMERLLVFQAKAIKDCCGDKTCQSYFANRTVKFNENRAKENSSK